MEQQIFTNAASGDSTLVEMNGGSTEITVAGTFGGCTVTLYRWSVITNTWVPFNGITWSSAACKLIDMARPCKLKLTITGGAGVSINAWI